jgi:hypothetical protein
MIAAGSPTGPGTGATLAPTERAVWGQALVMGLAFLLALTTARNSDIWAHLASGRAAVSGSRTVETGFLPLSWLADVAMYFTYTTVGGPGLVFGKAFIIAGLAAVMFGRGVSRRTILGVLLAILALSAWLPLNPVCLSYLFMALTVSALDRSPGALPPGGLWYTLRSHGWLLVCYAVWANADLWCLLGVILVVACAVGRTLVRAVRKDSFDPVPWRILALVAAGAAMSPLPWHASSVMREFANSLTNADLLASPFRVGVLSAIIDRRFEGAMPVLAFWLLVAVGLWSFVTEAAGKKRGGSGEWFLSWVGLLVAAAIDIRFAPFFVVVSGTMVARNFCIPRPSSDEEGHPIAGQTEPELNRFQIAARGLARFLTAAVLLAVAWAGWLQPAPAERRNWTVEPDPSLVRAAEEVGRWYATGALGADQQTVFYSREAEDVFAWFAPEVFSATGSSEWGMGSVGRVRAAILSPDPGNDPLVGGAHPDPRVGCLVLSDPNRVPFVVALRKLSGASDRWKLAHLRGRVAVFVRASAGLAPVHFSSRAFAATTADRTPAPSEPQLVEPPRWSDPFVVPRPPRSMDRDEAVTYLLHEEFTRDLRMVGGANRFLASLAASVVAAPPHLPVEWVLDQRVAILAMTANWVKNPLEGRPPIRFGRFPGFLLLTEVTADHYLAVRAARRGVAASPRDPATYTTLGEAYLGLLSDPLEASWCADFPALRRLRQVQAATAFRQAVVLDPAFAAAHLGLARVYREQRFLDLTATEYQAAERSVRDAGLQPEEMAELTQAVTAGRQATEANAANMSVLDRARLAAEKGLPGLALETLLQSDVAAFGSPGIAMEMDLMLSVGRVGEARKWLAPEHRNGIGAMAYDWLQCQAAAASGDYAAATSVLRTQVVGPPSAGGLLSAKEFWGLAEIVFKSLYVKEQTVPRMGAAPRGLTPAEDSVVIKQQSLPRMVVGVVPSLIGGVNSYGQKVAYEYQTRTETYVLLALLALEQGDTTACAAQLERVLTLWEDVDGAGILFPSPVRTIAGQMASLIGR